MTSVPGCTTRAPEALRYAGWTSGVDLAHMRELVGYWATSFDWRAQERRLNAFSQFTTYLDRQLIQVVHVQGAGPRLFPLVLTPGWPRGSRWLLPRYFSRIHRRVPRLCHLRSRFRSVHPRLHHRLSGPSPRHGSGGFPKKNASVLSSLLSGRSTHASAGWGPRGRVTSPSWR